MLQLRSLSSPASVPRSPSPRCWHRQASAFPASVSRRRPESETHDARDDQQETNDPHELP